MEDGRWIMNALCSQHIHDITGIKPARLATVLPSKMYNYVVFQCIKLHWFCTLWCTSNCNKLQYTCIKHTFQGVEALPSISPRVFDLSWTDKSWASFDDSPLFSASSLISLGLSMVTALFLSATSGSSKRQTYN